MLAPVGSAVAAAAAVVAWPPAAAVDFAVDLPAVAYRADWGMEAGDKIGVCHLMF